MSLKQPFELSVVSIHSRNALSVVWLEIITTKGEIVIAAGHAPFIGILRQKSVIVYQEQSGAQSSLPVSSGIFYMDGNRGLLLIKE